MTEKSVVQPNVSHEQIIREWLTEFKSLPKSSLDEYANNVKKKSNLIKSFHVILTSSNNSVFADLIQPVCHQLFEFYRCGYVSMKLFAISAFPCIIDAYYKISVSTKNINELYSIETFLLSVYNLICGDLDNVKETSLFSANGIDIPNIIISSVYHDSMAYPFSERTVSMSKHSSSGVRAQLPVPLFFSSMISSNRDQILCTIMLSYLERLSLIFPTSYLHLCDLCLDISCCGFPWEPMYFKGNRYFEHCCTSQTNLKHDISIFTNYFIKVVCLELEKSPQLSQYRRIPIAPELCLVILRCVYFALYNNRRADATKAVQAMLRRARYEMWPKVLLLCNAILNSVFHEKATSLADSPLGISIVSTPSFARSSTRIVKQAVTAKSIKHHKWSHVNEEVSGDITESLQQETIRGLEVIPSTGFVDTDETSKTEKVTMSPAKLLKSKIKKNTPFPSTNSPGEKPRFLAFDKKGRKSLTGINITEEAMNLEGRSRTPSGGTVEYLYSKPNKVSSTSVPSLRQLSLEDTSKRFTDKRSSLTKSEFEASLKVSKEPLKSKLSDGSIATSTSTKKSKFDKRNKSKMKDSENKELLKASKLKTDNQFHSQFESTPLLNDSRTGAEESNSTVTTQL